MTSASSTQEQGSLAAIFSSPRRDLVAGVVVFLIALPLCLGLAVACGVPPISGLVAGIVGGLVVPWISGSPLSVSGPAAGLTAIVLAGVKDLGGLPAFLTATIAAGIIQVAIGFLRAGVFASIVPSAVIRGMLAAIGLLLIGKQLPAAVGASSLKHFFDDVHAGATVVSVVCLALLFGWKRLPLAKLTWLSPALFVVIVGTVMSEVFRVAVPPLVLTPDELVGVPTGGPLAIAAALPHPDFYTIVRPDVWMVAGTIAVVASLETLLSLQAIDRLDPKRRQSPPDRELIAQGAANAASGLLGGLPITAVIVRSGANVAAGGRERLSAIVHGVLLVIAVFALAPVLNHIPIPCLAAILLQVGYSLCNPELVRAQVRLGVGQLAPFAVTVAAILFTNLLTGVIVGVAVGILFMLVQNARGTVETSIDGERFVIRFRRDANFLSKPDLLRAFETALKHRTVLVDASTEHVDHDVREAVAGFVADARARGVEVEIVGLDVHGVALGH